MRASPAYLAAHGRPATPADLARHECLLYSYASAGAVRTFSGVSGEEILRVGGRIACNNGDAIRARVIARLGVVARWTMGPKINPLKIRFHSGLARDWRPKVLAENEGYLSLRRSGLRTRIAS